MPDDPNVWIIIAVVIALVFIVAILKGKRRLRVTGPAGTGAELDGTERKISVLDGVSAENVEAGNVVGSRSQAGSMATEVSVMNKAVIRGGKFADIVGEEIKPAEPPKKVE